MFERAGTSRAGLEGLLSALSALPSAAEDGERVDQLDLLERVKAACAAAQARVTVELAESQAEIAEGWRERARAAADVNDFETWRRAREQSQAACCPEADDATDPSQSKPTSTDGRHRRGHRSRVELGVAAQVALARRESPHVGSRLVRLAFALTHEMPHLFALLERGLVSERRAVLVVQECATLSLAQRARVDAELDHIEGDQLGRLSEKELTSRVRAITYRLDAQAAVERAAYAENQRLVTLRPAPDTMCWLTALLPADQGVAALAALTKAADSARASGDARSKGQVMADTLVERVTGQAEAKHVQVEVQLVVTDRALLSGDETPACLIGYGSVPAAWARRLLTPIRRPAPVPCDDSDGSGDNSDNVAAEVGERAQVWLRRLYTHPGDGTLVGMDSTRRLFDGPLRTYLLARDGRTCRTPGCGAPIRHLDHVTPHAQGGPTSAVNGQGLCVRCNLVKELFGWYSRVVDPRDPRAATGRPGDATGPPGDGQHPHTVQITTPTGHHYASTAPPLLPEDPLIGDSPLERAWEVALALAA